MEELTNFLSSYGWVITLIAVVGIILLGILKYCNVFKSIEESKRHYIYIAISVGLSVIATLIYLAIIGQFTIGYICAIAAAIYALNQTFYNIFKVTPINELAKKCLDYIIAKIKKAPTEECAEGADAGKIDE